MSLIVDSVSKSFVQGESEIKVLQNVSFKLTEGDITAIVGESGSGKSTLLGLLAGLDRPDKGIISISGSIINNFDENQITQFRSNNISIVFQQYHLIPHLTAIENVMLPLEIRGESKIKERAMNALREMGLENRIDHLPSQLSGGECQRTAIARALVVNPKLLLADEPSGNLDSDTGEKVMDYFFSVIKKHNITAVLVTHSEQLANKCKRILKLKHGIMNE